MTTWRKVHGKKCPGTFLPIEIFNGEKWHWAFYSFREDTWAGMDYEVGEGEYEPAQLYPPNPLWDVICGALLRR